MIEFLEADNGDISVTKFLHEYEHALEDQHHYYEGEDSEDSEEWEYAGENTIMSNDQQIEKNAKKRGKKKKNGKKSKKPFGGPNEDVVFVEFLETDPFWLF